MGLFNKGDSAKGAVEHIDRAPSPSRVYVPGSPEEKALLRKIDFRLVPVVWIMYVMSYLDRANIGNAKTGGMQKDLNLTSNQYSIALLVFFIGYVLGEVPSNMVLSRVRPSIYLPVLMIVWGGISIALAGCHTYQQLAGVRLVLGFVEAGFSPGVLYLLSSWYRKNELATRYCLYYTASAISGALGGLLAGAITGNVNANGFEGWRWLFIIEGVATIGVSAIGFFFLPDWPSTTRWLTADEKWLAAARLSADDIGSSGEGLGDSHGHWASFKQSLSDWRTWVMTFIFMMVTGSQTIQYFIPTLMTLIGYKGTTAQYMTIPVYMVAVAFILIIPMSSDRFKERPNHLSAACAMSVISFFVLIFSNNRKVQYAFLCFAVGGIYASAPITLVWTSNIISWPSEKRAVTQAFVNAMGNSASIYGSFLWPATDFPKYYTGFGTTLGMCAACGIAAQVMKVLIARYPYPVPENSTAIYEDKLEREPTTERV